MNSPLLAADFYKLFHREQYPSGTTKVFSNWTARASRIEGQDKVIHFGLQYFIKKILIDSWNEYFFDVTISTVIRDYKEVLTKSLGIKGVYVKHIEALHKLGYLPIDIYSLPEGTAVPLGIPSVVIVNTNPDFYWLPNYLETVMSAYLWKPSTSATTATRYRKILEKWGKTAGEKDLSYIDYQAHDFSMRGMSGLEDAVISGMGHLTCFKGTDCIPAILAANEYYGAALSCGSSIPATEHSVMCAGTQEDELETFRRLIEDIYPSGPVGIVSDTWDLWKVLTEYVPALRDKILKRDGTTIFRPDSGTPEDILCGSKQVDLTPGLTVRRAEAPARGVLRLLAEHLGTIENPSGKLPLIDHAAAIYGDSITPERANTILQRTVEEIQLSPKNVAFGVGSFTYEYVTRDTYGFAMKATAIEKDGEIIPIFKKPITDSGTKTSRKGILAVYGESGNYTCKEESLPKDLDNCAFNKGFSNGDLLVDETFDNIRARVRSYTNE